MLTRRIEGALTTKLGRITRMNVRGRLWGFFSVVRRSTSAFVQFYKTLRPTKTEKEHLPRRKYDEQK